MKILGLDSSGIVASVAIVEDENLIAEYRSNFNKQVKEYNRYVRQFPARLFLNILGYEMQTYDYLDYNAPVDAPQNLFGD